MLGVYALEHLNAWLCIWRIFGFHQAKWSFLWNLQFLLFYWFIWTIGIGVTFFNFIEVVKHVERLFRQSGLRAVVVALEIIKLKFIILLILREWVYRISNDFTAFSSRKIIEPQWLFWNFRRTMLTRKIINIYGICINFFALIRAL